MFSLKERIIHNFIPAAFPQSDDYNQFSNLFNYKIMGSLITLQSIKYSGEAATVVGIQVIKTLEKKYSLYQILKL